MSGLGEAERKVLHDALIADMDAAFNARNEPPHLRPVIEAIIATNRADAWDEGNRAAGADYLAGWDAMSAGDPCPEGTSNPYHDAALAAVRDHLGRVGAA